jgi:hypothetical protein
VSTNGHTGALANRAGVAPAAPDTLRTAGSGPVACSLHRTDRVLATQDHKAA